MFFLYNQNNSGGYFHSDGSVAHSVIIEADSAEQADSKAQDIGIYFDGVENGMDCDCCGDRWHRAYGEGDAQPEIYGTPVEEYREDFCRGGDVYCYVYYADGTVKRYE